MRLRPPKTQRRPSKALLTARCRLLKALPMPLLLLALLLPRLALLLPAPVPTLLQRLPTRQPKPLALRRKLPTPPRARWKKPRSKLLFSHFG